MSHIKITYIGANQFRVRGKGPVSVTIYKPSGLDLNVVAERVGRVITEWEPLGRVLAFFTADRSEWEEAARSLDIKFTQE